MQFLRRYLLLINVLTFMVRGRDKYKARKKQRRISEKQLLLLSLMGGWIGAYLGMMSFRHKTIKGSFLWKFRSIVVIWIAILLGIFIKLPLA